MAGEGRDDRWDYVKALEKAKQRIAASGCEDEPEPDGDSLKYAMSKARQAAPALVDLVQALTLGTDPEELDNRRGGVRIMAELAVRQLAIVGLKSGETVEHDVSDRLRDALALFFQPAGERPVILEHDAGEPVRRLSDPHI